VELVPWDGPAEIHELQRDFDELNQKFDSKHAIPECGNIHTGKLQHDWDCDDYEDDWGNPACLVRQKQELQAALEVARYRTAAVQICWDNTSARRTGKSDACGTSTHLPGVCYPG
jgi:hypothetical protein